MCGEAKKSALGVTRRMSAPSSSSGKSHGDAGLLFDLVLKPRQRRFQRLGRQAEIVADLEDLADDLVRVFLPHADRVHDVARGHGDFGGVDAEGAVDRAAAALGALVKVAVPLVEHFPVRSSAPTSQGAILPESVKWRR